MTSTGRGCSNGRWGVMEQQPGHGELGRASTPLHCRRMVALWTLEAAAHRGRVHLLFPLAPGALRAVSRCTPACCAPTAARPKPRPEVRGRGCRAGGYRPSGRGKGPGRAGVFLCKRHGPSVSQPQGQSFRYLELVFEAYSALRARGPGCRYRSPAWPTFQARPHGVGAEPADHPRRFDRKKAGRAGLPGAAGSAFRASKTVSFGMPEGLAPGALRDIIPLTVTRVESLRDGSGEAGEGWGCHPLARGMWRATLRPKRPTHRGRGVVFRKPGLPRCVYLRDLGPTAHSCG